MADGKAFRAETPGRCGCATRRRSRAGSRSGKGSQSTADGSLMLDHPLADTDWAVRHVLQYGPDAEVLEPAAVREEIVRRLEGLRG